MKKQNKKGFTLVELLVVIAILAILATVSVVGYSQFTEKAKKSNDETELHQYSTLIQAQLMDGEEVVKIGSDEYTIKYDTTNGVTFKKGTTDVSDAAEITKVVNALLGDEKSTVESSTIKGLATGGQITVSYADAKLTLTYTHNITVVNAINVEIWTIEKAVYLINKVF